MGRNELRSPAVSGPDENIRGVLNMPLSTILNWLATKIDPQKAADKSIVFNLRFIERNELWELSLNNSVLNYQRLENARQFFSVSETLFKKFLADETIPEQAAENGEIAKELAGYLEILLSAREDKPNFWFNIVMP